MGIPYMFKYSLLQNTVTTIGMISILLFGTIACNFDSDPKTTRGKEIFESAWYADANHQKMFEEELTRQKISYTVNVENDGKHFVQWRYKDHETVARLQESLFGKPLPKNNINFDPNLNEQFKSWLTQNNIPYKTQFSDGIEYVTWEDSEQHKIEEWLYFPKKMVQAPEVLSSEEICYSINPASAIDKAFVDALGAANLTYVRSDTSTICMDKSLVEKASNIREKIERAYPQACMSFDRKESYTIMEKGIRDKGLAYWREKNDGSLCYLKRDSELVENIVSEKVNQLRSASGR